MVTQYHISEHIKAKEAALAEADKDYLDMLGDQPSRASYFGKLIHPEEGDHSEIKKVKSKIAKLLEQEAGELGFKNQLSKEELSEIAAETHAEVATNSSFYFSYDSDKVKKNIKVVDFEAPGNKYRHPNVILPHEHCDIQHYIDTKELTQDKLTEIYAYYSLLIDMHIA